jgi:hypothetical protein
MISFHGSCTRSQLAPPFVVDLRIGDVAYAVVLGLNLEAQSSPLRLPRNRIPATAESRCTTMDRLLQFLPEFVVTVNAGPLAKYHVRGEAR